MPPLAVVDASVVLQLLFQGSPRAAALMRESELTAPAFVAAETANGLATQVRFGGLELGAALALFGEFAALPLLLVPDAELGPDAIALAEKLELSAYDASYIALAERLDAPVVTADVSLAERYDRSELIH